MLYTPRILQNPCHHNNIILWPLAKSYINDQYKNIQCCIARNHDFGLNTLLHGALQLLNTVLYTGDFLVGGVVWLCPFAILIQIVNVRFSWKYLNVHLPENLEIYIFFLIGVLSVRIPQRLLFNSDNSI